MRSGVMTKLMIATVFGMSLFIFNPVHALEQKITQAFTVSGKDKSVVLTPYQFNQVSEAEYSLYEIDYHELKRQISIYKTIYLYGQLAHGALMIKMKPKFVD